MPAHVSEAIVLRTYPFKESDLVVSFLSREHGKLRGVAKRARRPKSSFGSGLERLSQVNMHYYQRPTRELVNLDSCELIHSQFGLLSDYGAAVTLDYFAEVSEQLLPPNEPNERYFRLLLAVLDHLRSGDIWLAITYFSVWALRLSGFLPDLHMCIACGAWLEEAREHAYFMRIKAGLYCGDCRAELGSSHTWTLSSSSRDLAQQILRKPVAAIAESAWTQDTAADLRRFLFQQIETHIERKLVTVPALQPG